MGVCGTPGTGKKSIAPLVAASLGVPSVAINSLVPGAEGRRKREVEVDPAKLRARLLASAKPGEVVYGHLLPHVVRKEDAGFVALLRCEPSVLKKRLKARGYEDAKVKENVEAELIGVLLDECVERFGGERVHEYDTTDATPRQVASEITLDVRLAAGSGGAAGQPGGWIDWTLGYDSPAKLRALLAAGKDPPAST